jgi:hypothetical protein
MKTFLLSAAIVLITTAAVLQAFFPNVLPRVYNLWYSLTGMKTRVSIEDYQKWSVRSVGIIILVLEIGAAAYRLAINNK